MALYFGKGTDVPYGDYIDFINYVFGFDGHSHDFVKLLPKLYRPEHDPAASNYVAVEDGRIRAAIGAYDVPLSVCGTVLRTRGIGNVAVHPYSRSRGYMKKLLTAAVDDMVSDGIVLSALGGRRQRYNYFSYDKVGLKISMALNDNNARYRFGSGRKPEFEFRTVGSDDAVTLGSIRRLAESQQLFAQRRPGGLYDVLVSWEADVYAGFIGGEFAGYAVADGGEIAELLVEPRFADALPRFCVDLRDRIGKALEIKLPVHLDGYISRLMPLCEGYYLTYPCMFSVLDFRAVSEAFMRLKATYAGLPDGELSLSVDGRGGREDLTFRVRGGNPSVERTGSASSGPVLGHIEAMNLIFAPYCPAREALPSFARLWFPLPLFMYHTDGV